MGWILDTTPPGAVVGPSAPKTGWKGSDRWHCIGRQRMGELVWVRTAEITVRSMSSVGGKRPGRRMTRKNNRIARKFGHATFAELVRKSLAQAAP